MPYARKQYSTSRRYSARRTYRTRSSSSKVSRPPAKRTYTRSYKPKSATVAAKPRPSVTRAAPVAAPVTEDKFDRNIRRANEVVSLAGRFMPIDLKKDTTMLVSGVSKAIGNLKISEADVSKVWGKVFKL